MIEQIEGLAALVSGFLFMVAVGYCSAEMARRRAKKRNRREVQR